LKRSPYGLPGGVTCREVFKEGGFWFFCCEGTEVSGKWNGPMISHGGDEIPRAEIKREKR